MLISIGIVVVVLALGYGVIRFYSWRASSRGDKNILPIDTKDEIRPLLDLKRPISQIQCRPEEALARLEADRRRLAESIEARSGCRPDRMKKQPTIIENATLIVPEEADPGLGSVCPLDVHGRPVDAYGRPLNMRSNNTNSTSDQSFFDYPASGSSSWQPPSASSNQPTPWQPPSSSSNEPNPVHAPSRFLRAPTGNILPIFHESDFAEHDARGNVSAENQPNQRWFPTFGDDRKDRVMSHNVRGQKPSKVTGTAMPAYAIDLTTGAPADPNNQNANCNNSSDDDNNCVNDERNMQPDANSVPPPQAGAAMAPQIGTGATWVERDDMPTPTYFANGTAGEGVVVDAVVIPTSQGIITQTAWFDIPPNLQQ